MLKISTAPHLNAPLSTRSIMFNVILALLPTLIAGIMFFGFNALLVVVTSVAGCVAFEYLFCRFVTQTETSTWDLSAVVTGLLLAFNLPATIPLWMVLVGCFMAIILSKMVYGGIGKNMFNPALVGRVFLFISFPVEMTTWIKPQFLNFMSSDAQTAATPLKILKHLSSDGSADELPSYFQMFVGNIGGCIGEVSTLAILIGFVYLLYKRIISWHITFYYLSSFFILISLHWLITKSPGADPLAHLLSGGLMLGAVFMATDYTTSPMSPNGKIIFAIGCGVLTYIIRIYGVYPEGVSFAILIMNAFVPLIDKLYIPRLFGTARR